MPHQILSILNRKSSQPWTVIANGLNFGDCYAAPANARSRFGEGGGDKTIKRPGYTEQNLAVSPRQLPPGLKGKDLVGQPWRIAFALQADGDP
jgi:hypothetical protein